MTQSALHSLRSQRGRWNRARSAALAGCFALCLEPATGALANGRPPATMSVHTRPNHPEEIYVGSTFGLLISKDDGCSFRWVCEQNLGYAGAFDPKYEIAADGTIYATTYEGLRVSRDGGCSFSTATADQPAGPGKVSDLWVDAIAVPASGAVWIATAESGQPNNVYRSTDGARTFSPMGLSSAVVWYKSVAVARSDEQRVWVTGYQVAGPNNAPPTAHLYRSDDGGANWDEVSLTGLAFAPTPNVVLAAVEPTAGDVVFLRSVAANGNGGDILYRSADAGATWTEVLRSNDELRGVVMRDQNEVLVASPQLGVQKSSDGGKTFIAVAESPRTNCLAQRADRQLLTCAPNWEPDFLAVGRSADGAQWQKIFRFVELAGPVQCPAGTPQADQCEAQLWPSLREQFGVTGPRCGATADGLPPDAGADVTSSKPGGCCDSGSSAIGSLWLALICFAWCRRSKGAAAVASRRPEVE